jgi:hypothetical protein
VGRHGLVAMCGTLRILCGTVSYCHSVGQVIGMSSAGGLVGSNECGDISNCFWDVQSSQQPSMSGGMALTVMCVTTGLAGRQPNSRLFTPTLRLAGTSWTGWKTAPRTSGGSTKVRTARDSGKNCWKMSRRNPISGRIERRIDRNHNSQSLPSHEFFSIYRGSRRNRYRPSGPGWRRRVRGGRRCGAGCGQ